MKPKRGMASREAKTRAIRIGIAKVGDIGAWGSSSRKNQQGESELVQTMARLVLRHEDSLSIAASENSYMMFLKANVEWSILPQMLTTASINLAIRAILFQQMLQEPWRSQVLKAVVEAKLNRMFSFLQWDEKEKRHMPKALRAPCHWTSLCPTSRI